MISPLLRRSVFISLLGHIAVFGIFSFSFGNRITRLDYANVAFWGGFLRSFDFNPLPSRHDIKFTANTYATTLDKGNRDYYKISNSYLKPAVNLALSEEKSIFIPKSNMPALSLHKEKPVIIFYPRLPQHFLLYFKDRQVAHIELMFNVVGGASNHITIKRKISSGNLEADLLSMRYIERYLFIQKESFASDKWQTVKIDLSARND